MMTPDTDDGWQVPTKDRNSEKNLCKTKEHSSQIMIYTVPGSISNSA